MYDDRDLVTVKMEPSAGMNWVSDYMTPLLGYTATSPTDTDFPDDYAEVINKLNLPTGKSHELHSVCTSVRRSVCIHVSAHFVCRLACVSIVLEIDYSLCFSLSLTVFHCSANSLHVRFSLNSCSVSKLHKISPCSSSLLFYQSYCMCKHPLSTTRRSRTLGVPGEHRVGAPPTEQA
jgi:hypothetical protein